MEVMAAVWVSEGGAWVLAKVWVLAKAGVLAKVWGTGMAWE